MVAMGLRRGASRWLLLGVPMFGSFVAASPAAAGPNDELGKYDWVHVPAVGDERSLFERTYGAEAEAARQQFAPFEQDGNVYTADSWSDTMLQALDLPPLPAVGYDASPGVVYVAMEGLTLSPDCSNGDFAHSALNCTTLVPGETAFPPVADEALKAAAVQRLAMAYEPFNLVLTTQRPPEYLPYTMIAVGGSSNLIEAPANICGRATVTCNGFKRNSVSVGFPDSCPGAAALSATIGQETAHNWGLEHTDNTSDLMYPLLDFNAPPTTFIDACMDISHATGDGKTQCGNTHEAYCDMGAGEQQNSHAELLGVFGAREEDETTPVVTMQPADGAVLTTADTFTVTASITDNTRTIGVKWSWLEGLPPTLDSLTRCTNDVCDNNYEFGISFDPGDATWDFVALDNPPPGTYSFQLEVIDAHGNGVTQVATFEVIEDEAGETGDEDDDGDDGAVDETDGGEDDGEDEGEDDALDDDLGEDDGDTDGGEDDGTGDGAASGDADDTGCRIGGQSGPRGALWLVAVVLVLRRRRSPNRSAMA